jgi:hypothetical protein
MPKRHCFAGTPVHLNILQGNLDREDGFKSVLMLCRVPAGTRCHLNSFGRVGGTLCTGKDFHEIEIHRVHFGTFAYGVADGHAEVRE